MKHVPPLDTMIALEAAKGYFRSLSGQASGPVGCRGLVRTGPVTATATGAVETATEIVTAAVTAPLHRSKEKNATKESVLSVLELGVGS